METDKTKIVVIREFSSFEEASLAKDILDAEGIVSALWDENMATVYPGVPGIATIRLAVNEKDASRAGKLIDEAMPVSVD